MKRDFEWIRDVIEKRRHGFIGNATRLLLFTLSIVYRLVIDCRNWAYNSGFFKHRRVNVPVVSVGNLTVGGTGKTPIVIWLAKALNKTFDVAIVSRGYGSKDQSLNDEGQEIADQIPEIVQTQNRDRVAAAQTAIRMLEAVRSHRPLVILDDGFQHRRLGRDLDILVVDATQPYGLGHLLPRGFLREPLSSASRANAAILTRANLVTSTVRESIKNKFVSLNPDLKWAESKLVCNGCQSIDQTSHPIEFLHHRKLLAFCGIGNPAGFVQTLQNENLNVLETIVFPDHHDYTEADVRAVLNAAAQHGCGVVVCTRKDLVKIDSSILRDIPIVALMTEIQFLSGEHELMSIINSNLAELEDSR